MRLTLEQTQVQASPSSKNKEGNNMAKDPAFLFYYQDFLVGTAFMTLEEVGAYIKVLCHLADKSVLPEEQILKIIPQTIWTAIKGKFKSNAKGFYNERLNEEVEKRKLFCESRRRSRRMNNVCVSHESHTENENINEDEDVNGKGVKGCGEKGKKVQTLEERIVSVRAVFEDKDFMETAHKSYPSVVFDKELLNMETWIKANPKMSSKSNWKRFVNNWLRVEQERLGKDGRNKQDPSGHRSQKLREITKVVDV